MAVPRHWPVWSSTWPIAHKCLLYSISAFPFLFVALSKGWDAHRGTTSTPTRAIKAGVKEHSFDWSGKVRINTSNETIKYIMRFCIKITWPWKDSSLLSVAAIPDELERRSKLDPSALELEIGKIYRRQCLVSVHWKRSIRIKSFSKCYLPSKDNSLLGLKVFLDSPWRTKKLNIQRLLYEEKEMKHSLF